MVKNARKTSVQYEKQREIVGFTKRNANGKPLPKPVLSAAMDLDKNLNTSILDRTPPAVFSKPTKAKNKKRKEKTAKKTDEIGSITERAARHNIASALANAALRILLGNILQEDPVRIQKKLRKMFENRTVRGKKLCETSRAFLPKNFKSSSAHSARKRRSLPVRH